MPYVDQAFYTSDYGGTTIPDDELASLLSRASDAIDQLTYYRIGQRGGIDSLTAFQQRQVKLAVCVQADFVYSVVDMPDWVKSYSVGSVSVSKADKASTKFSPQCLDYLRPTNLVNRGLG